MRPLLLLCCACAALAQDSERLDFLAGHTDFRQVRGMLPSFQKAAAARLLEARQAKVAALSSAQDVAERKRYLRERMIRALGGLPERTPLNARTAGVLERDDYRIEKVIFESQPKFYVTANLYLPKRGAPPYPAILFPLGHEAGAKANPVWQQILGNLARRGFVALAWDTLGQGERTQLWDPDLRDSKAGASTSEHTMLGIQCLLAGDNVARYTIWDGIRALDYLLARPEVDAKRIGCTGNSGGGTHTAYLSALDDRIQVAAPSCYLTSWRRLLDTIGPQDAEQCIPPWLADGLDHPDFILAFAPKPYLMLSAIRDFFSITGARETFSEARRVYELLGAGEKLDMVEADDGHGYSKPRRVPAYRWFSRWLNGVDDDGAESEIPVAGEEELYCTATGQVATALGGETVWSLNRKRVAQLARKAASRDDVARQIGYERPQGAPVVHPFGRLERPALRIEKLVYETEPGIVVPALLYVPQRPGRKAAVVLAHGRGKSAAASQAEQLAGAGLVVLSIDARGLGETRRAEAGEGAWARSFGDYESAMTALLLGRTLVGMRAADITRGVDLLAGHREVDAARIYGFGQEAGAAPLLHAAALDQRIRKVALEAMLVSYRAVVDHPLHRGVVEQVVPGVLKSYDLPDLAALLAPVPVWVVDPTDPLGKPVPLDEAKAAFSGAANVRVARRGPSMPFLAPYAELVGNGAQ
ncbi:MAG: acetylxylan esterase [Acidobacteriota bacterium]